jgi:hypothetical protein
VAVTSLSQYEHLPCAVSRNAREAQQLGANGIPFFVIDRRYGIAGAQPADDLLSVLQQAWHEAHPLEMALGGESNADFLCGPDGCAPAVASAAASNGV